MFSQADGFQSNDALATTSVTGDADVRVNSTIGGDQVRPDSAAFSDGSYIVVWASNDANGQDIRAQRYNAGGAPVHQNGATAGLQDFQVDTTTDPNGAAYGYSRVTTLTGGGFVVTWTYGGPYGGAIYAQAYNGSGAAVGGQTQVNTTTNANSRESVVAATSDGGYIVTWYSDSGGSNTSRDAGDTADTSGVTLAQRFNSSGLAVSWNGQTVGADEHQVSTSTNGLQGYPFVLSLASGRELFLYGGGQTGDYDVYGKVYRSNGTVYKDEFQINTTHTGDQYWPEAVQLKNGNVIIAWESNGQDGSGEGIYGRMFDANGAALTGEFLVNTTTSGSQEPYEEGTGPRLAALANGGFVVTWHSDQGDGSGRGVYAQEFDSNTGKVGGEVQVNLNVSSDQSFPTVVATSTGFTVSFDSQATPGDSDQTSTYGIAQRSFAVEHSIVAKGGENQVNTHTLGDQAKPQVASAADGTHVVVWQSAASYDGGDGSGIGVLGQLYNADGSKHGGEFQINTYTAGDQNNPQVAWLDGANGFVVTWTSSVQNAGTQGVYAQLYSTAGARVGGEFLVNTSQTGANEYGSSIAALHGANAGDFVISWNDNSGAITAQRYGASGAALGSPISVASSSYANGDGPTFGDSYVTGTSDGGFVVDWSNGSPYGGDLLARRYDASGAPKAGINADGSAAAATGPFRVNSDSDGGHYPQSQSLTTLVDGGFVVTWTNINHDGQGYGVFGQLYNSDGSLRGGELQINTTIQGDQYYPAVAALKDGSFVVVWTSGQTDAFDGPDIYAERFAPDGTVLNQPFLVDTLYTSGDQRLASVAATADGFIVAWQDQSDNAGFGDLTSADGSGNGVFQKAFTVDGLNASSTSPVAAHTPTLTVTAAEGAEYTANPNGYTPIHLGVAAALSSSSASGDTLAVEISQIPVGAKLDDGHGHSFTATAALDAVDVSAWTLSGLEITPPASDAVAFALAVRATDTTSSGDTATTVLSLPVTIDPTAEAIAPGGTLGRVNSYATGDQVFQVDGVAPRSTIATYSDGSSVIVWTSNGEDGSANGVYGQRYDATGHALGGEFQVNATTLHNQQGGAVTVLSNGDFVVTWESEQQSTPSDGGASYDDIYARVYARDGTVVTGETKVNTVTHAYSAQNAPSITALSGGGYIIAWQSSNNDGSGYGVFAQRFNATGAAVHRDGTTAGNDEIQLNTTTAGDQQLPAIAALHNGGWVATWESQNQDGAGEGVFSQRFSSAGALVGTEVQVNSLSAGNQSAPVVATLTDGGYVIAWQDDVHDGSSNGVYARVYNADGTARSGDFLVNTYTNSDESAAAVTALADGGFEIAWHANEDYSFDVIAQRYDAQGDKIGGETLINTNPLGDQTFPSIAATPVTASAPDGGFIAAWQSNYYYSGAPEYNTTGIQARNVVLASTEVVAHGGESQVNTDSSFYVGFPQSATLASGKYVVVFQSKPPAGSAAAHDLSDTGVYAQIYNADGTRSGGQFQVNTTTFGEQAQPQVTALDNGDFVIVYHSAAGDGSGYGVFGQLYGASGAKLGSEFLVNTNTADNQTFPSVSALHGSNSSGFVVTWMTGTIQAQVFDTGSANSTTGPAKVGSEFTVDTGGGGEQGLTTNNQYLPKVAGTTDGGFTVVWQDDNAVDGAAAGVFAQRYTVDLTHTAAPATAASSVQPDGTVTSGNVLVETSVVNNQYAPQIAALHGGGYVVLFSDDGGDISGVGLEAQIFNADGSRRGGEFLVNSFQSNSQGATSAYGSSTSGNYFGGVSVIALSDGSFVAAWNSNQYEASGYDIYAKRFAADGSVLNDEFRLNTTTLADQVLPTLTPTATGFAASWADGSDNYNTVAVTTQQFQIHTLGAAPPVLTTPAAVIGNEDTAIPFSIAATKTSSETLAVEISNIPVGATIADDNGHSFTSTAALTGKDVSTWDLAHLTITPPLHSTSAINLKVSATATDTSTGDADTAQHAIAVTVNPVVQPQAAYDAEFSVDTATATTEMLPKVASFGDGGFVVTWEANHPGSTYRDIYAHLYNVDGTSKGAVIDVSASGGASYSNGNYDDQQSSVTVLKDGGFLVSWSALDASGYGVYAERYNASGVAVNFNGTAASTSPLPTLLSQGTDSNGHDAQTNDQTQSYVTALADGGWVVAWQASSSSDGDNNGVFAERFNAQGAVVQMNAGAGPADVIQVNVAATGSQDTPSVIQLANGNLVFSYDSTDASGVGVDARQFTADTISSGGAATAVTAHPITTDSNGAALGTGGEFQVNSYANSDQAQIYRGGGLTTLAGGGFVAAWTSYGEDGNSNGVYGQAFNADGSKSGAEFEINGYRFDSQQEVQLAAQPDGGFIATWSSSGQDGSGFGVYGQRFDANHEPVGAEFRVNTTVTGDQSSSAIATQGDGSGVVITYENTTNVSAVRLPLPSISAGQAVEPVGQVLNQQTVNTTTANEQINPQMAKLADGSYVVTWQSNGQDGSGNGVYASHFSASGQLIPFSDGHGGSVAELQVNLYNYSEQYNAAVTALADGSFVVAWQSAYQDGSGTWGIYARHFDASGAAIAMADASGTATTNDLLVNSVTAGDQVNPSLTTLADGSTVEIAWQSNGQTNSYGIYSNHLSTVGGHLQLASATDVQVNTATSGDEELPHLAALAGGGSVAVWESNGATTGNAGNDGSSWGVFGQLLNADGSLHGSEFLINTHTTGAQVNPSVASLTGGGFVVVWQDNDNLDASYDGIFGQIYNADGSLHGVQFQIDANAELNQYSPAVSEAQDGGFLVTWASDTSDGNGAGIVTRRFDANGVPTAPYGDDIAVNSYTQGDQNAPAIVALNSGFVVAWDSANGGTNTDIEMQRFQGQGLTPPPLVVDASGATAGSYATVQAAVNAAHPGDVIEIVGGATAGTAVTYTEGVTVATSGLTFENETGTFAVVAGTAGVAALTVNAGLGITLTGDDPAHLVFDAGSGAASAVDLKSGNGDSVFNRVTVNASEASSGVAGTGHALLIEGGQNGIVVQASMFGGHTTGALVEVDGADNGATASSGVNFVNSTFTLNGGAGLVDDAQTSVVKGDLFTGWGSGAALTLLATGDDVEGDTFISTGGAYIINSGGYAVSTLLSQNAFPNGEVYDATGSNPNHANIYSTIAEGLAVAASGDQLEIGAGNYSGEAPDTVSADNLTIDAPASASGISLRLSVGSAPTHLTLTGQAAITVVGNNGGDTIVGNAGADTITGGTGADTLSAGSGATTLNGGGGADTLYAGGGTDTLQGGTGNDTYVWTLGDGVTTITDTGGDTGDKLAIGTTTYGSNDSVQLSASGGVVHATINGGSSPAINASGVEAITVTGDYNDSVSITSPLTGVSVVTVHGGDGSGGSANTGVVLNASGLGVATEAVLIGGAGADTLTGGNGQNVFVGNGGNDSFNGTSVQNVVDYSQEAGGGNVIVNLSASSVTVNGHTVQSDRALDSYGATDTLSDIQGVRFGAGNDTAYAAASGSTFNAGSGTDTLIGGAGNDSFGGGTGASTITGGGGSNSFYFLSSSGYFGQNDVVTDFDTGGASQSGGTAFDANTDVLRFDPAFFSSSAAVQSAANVSGGSTVISDGHGHTLTLNGVINLGAANIDIVGLNDAPTLRAAVPSAIVVEKGYHVSGTNSATIALKPGDVDGTASYDTAALTQAGWTAGSAAGTYTLSGTYGTATLNTSSNQVAYALTNSSTATNALAGGSVVTDSFTVPVVDNSGAKGSTAAVFTIQGTNDAPAAAADQANATAPSNTVAGVNPTGNVLANDTDPDTGDTLSVVSVASSNNNNASGTVGQSLAGQYGSLTLNASGGYSYVVDDNNSAVLALRPNSSPLVDTFAYGINDAAGAPSSTTLTVKVYGANNTPVLAAITQPAAVNEAVDASHQSVTVTGSLSVNDPDVGQTETPTATPTGLTFSGGTLPSGVNVSALDAASALTISTANSGSGSVALNYSYAPAATGLDFLRAGQTLTASYNVSVSDGIVSSNTQAISFVVSGTNDAPTLASIPQSNAQEAADAHAQAVTASGSLSVKDLDIGDTETPSASAATASYSGGALPSGADVAALTAAAALTLSSGTSTGAAQSLAWSYAPGAANLDFLAQGETLTITYPVHVNDGTASSSTQNIVIVITGQNDAPSLGSTGLTASVTQGTSTPNDTASGSIGFTDADASDTHTVSATADATGYVGTFTPSVSTDSTNGATGAIGFTYSVADSAIKHLAQGQSLVQDYDVTVADTHGGSAVRTVEITITGINDTPTAVADTAAVNEDRAAQTTQRSTGVLANDTDPDDGETALLVVTGVHAGTSGSDTAVSTGAPATVAGAYGSLTLNADGTYSYTAGAETPGSSGSRSPDVFTYTISDGKGGSASATLTFTPDHPPVATADTAAVLAGRTVTVTSGASGVLGNDSDSDGDNLTVSGAHAGSTGEDVAVTSGGTTLSGTYGELTLKPDGTYSYVADQGQAIATAADGQPIRDVFTYTVSDGEGGATNSTLTITIGKEAGGSEAVSNLDGSAVYSLGATTLTANESGSGSSFSGRLQDGSAGGPGSLVVKGTAALTLTGVNTYTGHTQVYSALRLSGSGSVAQSSNVALKASGAVFDISGASGPESIGSLNGVGGTVDLGADSLTVHQTVAAVFAGVIADGGASGGAKGSLVVQGTAPLTLTGANTYTGHTQVYGALDLLGSGSVAQSSNVALKASGAVFDISGASGPESIGNLNGVGGTVHLGGDGLTVHQTVAAVFAGVIADGGASGGAKGSLVVQGTAPLTLTGANTYTGHTQVYGALDLLGSGSVAQSSNVALKASGAVFDISGASGPQSIGNLNGVGGTVHLGADSLTVHQTVAAVFAGVIADGGVSGGIGGSLVLDGSALLKLSGASTYTGGTTLEGGALELGAVGAAGTHDISFAGSAELLIDTAALGDNGDTRTFANHIDSFATGDALDLTGLGYIPGSTATYADGDLLVSNGSSSVTLHLNGISANQGFSVANDGHGGIYVTETTDHPDMMMAMMQPRPAADMYGA